MIRDSWEASQTIASDHFTAIIFLLHSVKKRLPQKDTFLL